MPFVVQTSPSHSIISWVQLQFPSARTLRIISAHISPNLCVGDWELEFGEILACCLAPTQGDSIIALDANSQLAQPTEQEEPWHFLNFEDSPVAHAFTQFLTQLHLTPMAIVGSSLQFTHTLIMSPRIRN
eukprot:11564175-Prorocentrum_lima.AAC.1